MRARGEADLVRAGGARPAEARLEAPRRAEGSGPVAAAVARRSGGVWAQEDLAIGQLDEEVVPWAGPCDEAAGKRRDAAWCGRSAAVAGTDGALTPGRCD